MGSLESGGIYLAKVRFADKKSVSKIRPVLVLDDKKYIVTILKMTSKGQTTKYPVYKLRKWKSYGLKLPTFVRVDEVIFLNREDIFSDKHFANVTSNEMKIIVKLLLSN